MHRPTVTVVIASRDGGEALDRSLRSCARHIPEEHPVVVLDGHADSHGGELHVRTLLGDRRNVSYVSVDGASGLVETCNRVVMEQGQAGGDVLLVDTGTTVTEGFLEEMQACLLASERHGACCPRTSSGGVLVMPQYYDGSPEAFAAVSQACTQRMRPYLPVFTVVPAGDACCVLVRRSLIRAVGFLDSTLATLEQAVVDFCLRVNRLGFSTVMANRAFVFRTPSDPGREGPAAEADGARISARYPEYPAALTRYRRLEIKAAEHFADLLGGCYARKQIAFDLSRLPPAHSGTSEYALALWGELASLLGEAGDVVLLASADTDRFFGLSAHSYPVVSPMDGSTRRFDLVFTPHQVFTRDHLTFLNRTGVRLVHTLLDVIGLRCQYLQQAETASSVRWSVRYADGLVHISGASRLDGESYLGLDVFPPAARRPTILPGAPAPGSAEEPLDPLLAPNAFVLLVGNAYHHKAIGLALRHLPADRPVAVIGGRAMEVPSGMAVRLFSSGDLSPRLMEALYRQCACVLYPSQYEGLGFPLLHAAVRGKPVVAHSSSAQREVTTAFGIESCVYAFTEFDQIGALVRTAAAKRHTPIRPARTWKACAADTASFLSGILNADVDIGRLEERFSLVNALDSTRLPLRRRLGAALLRPFPRARRWVRQRWPQV